MTYQELLSKNGWERVDLFDASLDLPNKRLWAHITNPEYRHTRGVETYLSYHPEMDIDDPKTMQMLLSGVFDEHTYSLSMMLGPIFYLPIHWIPLDLRIPGLSLTGDDFTNIFFKENGIDIVITEADWRNKIHPSNIPVREKIQNYKLAHPEVVSKLNKNFLGQDRAKYYEVFNQYRVKYT